MPGTQYCKDCPAVYDTVQNVALTGGKQTIPVWKPIQTDTLQHSKAAMQHSKGGYFTIMGAYGDNAGCCDQKYVSTGCRSPGKRKSMWGY